MKFVSIFNDVLGPVMRGPSSSHTAGSYRIGRMACSLLGEEPKKVTFTFDPRGSYARVYQQQGVDLAFAAGMMAWPITDERFCEALGEAERKGLRLEFQVSRLKERSHPNAVLIELIGQEGHKLVVSAQSTGGGGILVDSVADWPIALTGKAYEILIEGDPSAESIIDTCLAEGKWFQGKKTKQQRGNQILIILQSASAPKDEDIETIKEIPGVTNVWISRPVFYVQRGRSLFSNYSEMVQALKGRTVSLGELSLEYESQLLGMTKNEVVDEILKRYNIMKEAIKRGLDSQNVSMQLLQPCAGQIHQSESAGGLPVGGLHTRAAVRAMAVMHMNNSMGVVCAAPTGGSSGVIPGVVATLVEEKKMSPEETALSLLAASAVGLLIAMQATFAAEVAGCQVEIGAAGAMAAAAVVEASGGRGVQALDAAAIALQNTMGSVCDLVQGMCEIPCHTRNAVAASSAFVCADLIMGGYQNPIPLDETIDAVYKVGQMLPSELLCTAMGGLAQTPSALALPRLR